MHYTPILALQVALIFVVVLQCPVRHECNIRWVWHWNLLQSKFVGITSRLDVHVHNRRESTLEIIIKKLVLLLLLPFKFILSNDDL